MSPLWFGPSLAPPAPTPERPVTDAFEERYWCGCVRNAAWKRCEAHLLLDHDEEPPLQSAAPAARGWRTSAEVQEVRRDVEMAIEAEGNVIAKRHISDSERAMLDALCDMVAAASASARRCSYQVVPHSQNAHDAVKPTLLASISAGPVAPGVLKGSA